MSAPQQQDPMLAAFESFPYNEPSPAGRAGAPQASAAPAPTASPGAASAAPTPDPMLQTFEDFHGIDAGAAAPRAQPTSGGLLSEANGWMNSADEFNERLKVGFLKDFLGTAHGIARALHALPIIGRVVNDQGLKEWDALSSGAVQADRSALETSLAPKRGVAEDIGGGLENIAEFALGDEALKGLSLAERLKQVSQVTKLLEDSPRLARLLRWGMSSAMRMGLVSAVQGGVKSAGAGDELPLEAAAEQGAIGAGMAGLGDWATGALRRYLEGIRPSTIRIAGEEAPLLASELPGATPAAQRIQIATEPAIREAQQIAGQKAVKNVAADAVDQWAQRLNLPTAGQLTPMSFGDAADALGGMAKPIFEKMDEASGGRFTQYRNAVQKYQRLLRRATSEEQVELYERRLEEAQRKIDGLFDDAQPAAAPESAAGLAASAAADARVPTGLTKAQLEQGRSIWRDMKVLQRVDGAVESAFDMPEAEAARARGGPAPRTLRGSSLRATLNAMTQRFGAPTLYRVLGGDGLTNLYRIADLTDKPATREVAKSALAQVAGVIFGAGGASVALGHPLAGAIEAGGGVAALALPKLERWLATDPEANRAFTRLVMKGASVPKVIVPVMLQLWRGSDAASQ